MAAIPAAEAFWAAVCAVATATKEARTIEKSIFIQEWMWIVIFCDQSG